MSHKIVTIHQPNHLPYLGFFDKMADADLFVLYDNTQYKSEDFQHRNRIRIPLGQGPTKEGWTWLSVPLRKSPLQTKIRDVQIASELPWREKHWNAITENYRKATFFAEYKPLFQQIYESSWASLADFNISLITAIRDAFGITTQLVRSSELVPDLQSRSTQALVDICKAAGATHYISGADGEKYVQMPLFDVAGIKVSFQHYNHPEYRQAHHGFVPYMSALDLLFNHGPDSLKILRGKK